MEAAGGSKDYWTIRQFLPKETQNYVPAYIATVYIMNNYRKHGIVPSEPYFNMETEVVPVKTTVSLDDLARQANLQPYQLSYLNPAYTRAVVKGSPESPRNVVIPVLPTPAYNAVCRVLGLPERVIPGMVAAVPVPPAKEYYYIMYSVQQGDTFAGIAGKFKGTAEEQIKEANKAKGDSLVVGRMLQIPVEKG
jgi:membrane-bound lytic murein transglycosylase D